MAKSSVAGKLKGIGGIWGKARTTSAADGGDFIPVDVGQYVCQLVGVDAETYDDSRKLRLKYAALDEESKGAILNDFMAIDTEEKLVWVQRLLIALSVDLDEVTVEDENDLIEVFNGLIAARTCVHVKVTEKDGYKNMRARRLAEVDEGDTLDPKKALKGDGKPTGGKQAAIDVDEGVGDDDEEAVDVGDEVAFELKGKPMTGTIVEFDDDEGAKVKLPNKKVVTVALNGLAKVVEEPAVDDDTAEIVKGSRVAIGEGKKRQEGEVTSTPPNTTRVQVTFDDGTRKTIERDELELVVEDDTAEEEHELAKGDKVIVKVKGKDKAGVVVSVNADESTCKVKVTGVGVVTKSIDDVQFQVDE